MLSFVAASQEIKDLAELEICPKRLERLARRIGEERREQEQALVQSFEALPLPQQKQSPVQAIEGVAVVGVDGGRFQLLERGQKKKASDAQASPCDSASCSSAVSAALPASEEPSDTSEPDVHVEPAEANRSKHWKESKIGCLMEFESEPSQEDPFPTISAAFVNPQRIHKLAREIGHPAVGVAPPKETPQSDAVACTPSAEKPSEPGQPEPPPKEQEKEEGSPQRVFRKVAATRQSYEVLGRLLRFWCWARGFQAAARKAFIGDGDHKIWALQQRFFPDFTPIVDFVHAISYVYQAAMAGRSHTEGWPIYLRWAQWLWEGEVQRIIEEIQSRMQELGPPQKGDSTSAAFVVNRALTYLSNHQDKMKYAQYRREGLPITTCNVETTVKQVNFRVKGTEKFWSSSGSDAMLQLRADDLSDDAPMEEFWKDRSATMTGFRNYKKRTNCAVAA